MMFDFILRIFVAGLMGALIGLEREYRAKEAGYRTHFLVSMGSALLMIVSQYGFDTLLGETGIGLDPSRIAAQVVTGIGFIGAGTIIINKQIVRGLTTAAGVWVTSGIGLAIGAGMYVLGICATFLVLAGLELLRFLFGNVGLHSTYIELIVSSAESLDKLQRTFLERGFIIVSYRVDEKNYSGNTVYNVSMVLKAHDKTVSPLELLTNLQGVTLRLLE
ncbi:MAG: MgtC/SapB family protein [Bacteroidaceae bacterium]|nr:MgtC/SapB family protein [Bacteroidaceae bacterium]